MGSAERRLRRATFDQAAELYDRVRPSYPAAVFEDLAELAGLGPGARVLEIGCGTGKATVALAERGYRIVAVELGPALAAVARRNLARFADVEVVVAAFEDWPLPAEPFDAVVSATAFHWIDPAVRAGKAADALRPGGALATIQTHHVAGGDTAFFEAVQPCYERWDPSTEPWTALPEAAEIPLDDDELRRSGRFLPAAFRLHPWDVTYSAAGYTDVVRTYSGSLTLAPAARDSLLACIAGHIERDYGGHVTKRYLAELRVAERAG